MWRVRQDAHLLAEFIWAFGRSSTSSAVVRCVAKREGKQVFEKLHRVILQAAPGDIIDHANGDTLDCRRENLRIADKSKNAANTRKARSAVGFKGVSGPANRAHMSKPYKARVVYQGVEHHLGWFATPEEAAVAYDAAAVRLFGTFAATNAALGLLGKKD